MNLLVLAAGYATRLYPLTQNTAKPLIEVAGKPMIEHVLDCFASLPDISRAWAVTNHRFASDFETWAQARKPSAAFFDALDILDDGTENEAGRLGAIGDIHFALHDAQLFDSDLLVVGGDNLFTEQQVEFVDFASEHPATIGTYDTGCREEVRKFASITTGADHRISAFEEKPLSPQSTWTGIALYYFRRDTLPLIDTYLREGNNPDQAGHLIEWLYHAYRDIRLPGARALVRYRLSGGFGASPALFGKVSLTGIIFPDCLAFFSARC